MTSSLLTTKLCIPPARPDLISRPRLIERLNAGLHRKLTLISAPAGFGKTTLLSEWAAGCRRPVAWVSLDEGDNDLVRFLAYLVGALQKVDKAIGQSVQGLLQSPQLPPAAPVSTSASPARHRGADGVGRGGAGARTRRAGGGAGQDCVDGKRIGPPPLPPQLRG